MQNQLQSFDWGKINDIMSEKTDDDHSSILDHFQAKLRELDLFVIQENLQAIIDGSDTTMKQYYIHYFIIGCRLKEDPDLSEQFEVMLAILKYVISLIDAEFTNKNNGEWVLEYFPLLFAAFWHFFRKIVNLQTYIFTDGVDKYVSIEINDDRLIEIIGTDYNIEIQTPTIFATLPNDCVVTDAPISSRCMEEEYQ